MKTRIPPSLGLNEARRLGVCRICRGDRRTERKLKDGTVDKFCYGLGKEYAHESCIQREKVELDKGIGI